MKKILACVAALATGCIMALTGCAARAQDVTVTFYDMGKADAALMDLSLEELKSFHPAFEQDVFEAMSLKTCVEGRCIPGGPAPFAVQSSIDEARVQLKL